MIGDLTLAAVWSAILFAAAFGTSVVALRLGILLASQSAVMLLAAVVEVRLSGLGLPPLLAYSGALLVGTGIGLAHYPLLKHGNSHLLTIFTVIGHVVLNEVWLAFPQITGGSGGILVQQTPTVYAIGLVVVLATMAIWAFFTGRAGKYEIYWAALRHLGPAAGVSGVPSHRLFMTTFGFYGLALGAIGVFATHWFGYLAPSSYSLSLALIILMISLAAARRGVVALALLCFTYAMLRVFVRNSVYASSTWSNFLDLVFPLLLLAYLLRFQKERKYA